MRETDLYTAIFKTWLMFYLFWPPLIFSDKIMQFEMRESCAKFNWTRFSGLLLWCVLQSQKQIALLSDSWASFL